MDAGKQDADCGLRRVDKMTAIRQVSCRRQMAVGRQASGRRQDSYGQTGWG